MHYYAYEKESPQKKYEINRSLQLIQKSFNHILGGFNMGRLLEPEELEIMINGLHSEEISIEDWKEGTEYK